MSYWGRVHREAYSRATRTGHVAVLNLLIGVVAVAGAIWGLSVWGSADAAFDELIGRSIIAVASIAGLILQYSLWIKKIPEEWDARKEAHIDELERERRAEMTLVFGNEGILRQTREQAGTKLTRIHVGVRNLSTSQAIDGAEVFLANVMNDDRSFQKNISRALKFVETEETAVTLNPRGTRYVYLGEAATRHSNRGQIHHFLFVGTDGWAELPAPLIFKLNFGGRNAPTATRRCRINFNDEGFAVCEEAN